MTTLTLASRFEDIERRLDRLERQIAALERLGAELQQLERLVGGLKYEVEEMQEA